LDLASWGLDGPAMGLVLSVLNIIIIDLVLAGDNAVVIAMAVRSLPRRQRLQGIACGAGAAVVLRVGLTFVVAQLLDIAFLKLAGGLAILWIAVKLFVEGAPDDEGSRPAKTLWQAMRLIVVADVTMSTDNVLAVAGASQGNLSLLIFGLALSIPFVVFASNLLSRLMDRYPVIIWLGSAVLGRVGGEMIFSDPWVVRWLNPSPLMDYLGQALFALGVLAAGRIWLSLKYRPQNS
jgi:YjbE family integral membrane protein